MVVLLSVLTACASEPVYTPDAATLAEREQQEYTTRITRWTWTWRAFYTAFVLILTVLVILAAALGQTVYRIHAAHALIEEAKARAAWVISLGDGYALDLQTGNTVSRYPNIPAEIPPVINTPRQPERQPTDGLVDFVMQAVQINDNDWTSSVIPRWDRWQEIGLSMSPAEWMRKTDELMRRGLIEKEQGKKTVTVGDLDMARVYESVLHSPTPSGGRL